MLTRYEELVISDRDRYGRFPASASLAGRAGLLAPPIVDSYVALLWSASTRAWPGLPRRSARFAVLITHDVDDPLATLGRSPRVVRQLGADLLCAGTRAWQGGVCARRPPLDADITALIPTTHSTSSWTSASATTTAARSTPRQPLPEPARRHISARASWVRSLIGHIHRRGHEVGLHASFHSYRDPQRTRDEFDRLRAVAEHRACAKSNGEADSTTSDGTTR